MYVSINLPMCTTSTMTNISGDREVTEDLCMLRRSFRNSLLQEQITLHINQIFLSKSVSPFSPLFLWRYRNISYWSYSGYHLKSLHLPTEITQGFFSLCTSNRKWVGALSYCCVISPCKFNLFIATTVAFKIENK